MIGRYVAKLLRGQGPKSNITEEFLREHGF
jgi:hypothetical protein